MGMPSERILKKMRAKLEKAQGTLALSPKPTPLEQFRWDICQEFIKYTQDHHLRSKDLAEKLDIHESDMGRILRHRIDRFSTDKLLELLMQLKPKLKIRLRVS